VDQSGAWNEATIAQHASNDVVTITNVMQSGGAGNHATVIQ
jgi:hypothetical protein